MISLLCVVIGYLLVGFGFSLSSWLQAAEREVSKGKDPSPFFGWNLFYFTTLWPLLALYCYRAEVLKTIEKVDFDKFK